jgi:hypothetical protein
MFNKEEFEKNGFIVLPEFYDITEEHLESADSLMTDYSYKIGRKHLTHNYGTLPRCLSSLVCTDEIDSFFNSFFNETLVCKDVMLTHEFRHDIMERNKWLHFDRWKSLKAMVYLVDVDENNGPLSIVPQTHQKSSLLRRNFKDLPYSIRPNRIELDYPQYYQEPTKITGKAGTLILFNSDIFHGGGSINEGTERMLIRSHWYVDRRWQETVE